MMRGSDGSPSKSFHRDQMNIKRQNKFIYWVPIAQKGTPKSDQLRNTFERYTNKYLWEKVFSKMLYLELLEGREGGRGQLAGRWWGRSTNIEIYRDHQEERGRASRTLLLLRRCSFLASTEIRFEVRMALMLRLFRKQAVVVRKRRQSWDRVSNPTSPSFQTMSGISSISLKGVQQLRRLSLLTYLLPLLQFINLTMLQKIDFIFSESPQGRLRSLMVLQTIFYDFQQLLKKEYNWFTIFDQLFFLADSSSFSEFLCLLFFVRRVLMGAFSLGSAQGVGAGVKVRVIEVGLGQQFSDHWEDK